MRLGKQDAGSIVSIPKKRFQNEFCGRRVSSAGGGLCAVAAHGSRDGLGTGSHIGLQSVLESARQRVGRWCAGCVRGSDAEVLYRGERFPPCPACPQRSIIGSPDAVAAATPKAMR
jgi:hypothetical protein